MKIIKCSSKTEFLEINARALEYFYGLGNTAAKWAEALYDSNGVICFTVEDVIMPALLESEVNRIEEVALADLTTIAPDNARRAAENYISKFFTLGERDHLTILLLSQNTKALQLYGWIGQVITKGISGQTDFETLGPPPLTYMEVVTS